MTETTLGGILPATITPLDGDGRFVRSAFERLLDRLWAHATQPRYAWKHEWRLGDLVLWDNRCAMHYRSEVDPTQVRVMYRTVIDGEAVMAG